MVTADEARRELARRELARRRGADGTYGQPPAGMVLNPETGQMEDLRSPINPNIPQGGALNAAAIGGGQGLGFGFLDEAVAAATVPFGGDYNYNVERMREADRRASAAHPYVKTGSQLAGGVASALGAGRLGLTLLGRGAPATMPGFGGLATRTGIAGVEGAGYGLLDAIGNDTNPYMGAGLGFAGGASGNLLGEGLQAGVNAWRGQPAQNYVARQAQADAITPESAQARLTELGPDANIADLGPNLRGQSAALAVTPGEGQQIVRTALNDRNAGAAGRITGAVDQSMGSRQGVLSLADDIVSMRSQQAKPLYDASRNVPVQMDEATQTLLSRPSAQRAIARAGEALADNGQALDLERPTIGMIDAIKKELDDMISPAIREGRNNEAARLMEIKNSIVGIADNASPEYAQARRVFSDASSVKTALEDGQKVFQSAVSPESLARQLSSMDEASREAYLIGARQQVDKIMGTARNDAAAAKRLFSTGYNKEKMSLILGDEQASALLNAIGAEEVFSATRNAAIGGSDTIPKGLAGGTIANSENTAGVIKSLLNLNIGDALSSAGDKVFGGAIKNRNERINAEIARILMGQGVDALVPISQSSAIRDNVTRSLIGAQAGM